MKEGFVRVPNRLWPILLRWSHSPAARKVFDWVIRETLGWRRAWSKDRFARSRVANDTGLNPTTVSKARRELEKAEYILLRSDGRVRINPRLLAADDPATDVTETGDVAKRPRQCGETATPMWPNGHTKSAQQDAGQSITAPHRHKQTVTDIKNTPASPRLDNSLSKKIWAEDVSDVLAHWLRRFSPRPGKASKGASWAGKIIKGAQRLEVSPLWLIDQVPPDCRDPAAYLMGYVEGRYPVPEMSDGERRHHSFHAWDTRRRKCQGPGSVTSIKEIVAEWRP